MYNPKSSKAVEFIDDAEILDTLKYAAENCENRTLIEEILRKAAEGKGCEEEPSGNSAACSRSHHDGCAVSGNGLLQHAAHRADE